MVALKDIATFVRAAAVIARQLPNVRFVVLGALHEDEPYVDRCRTVGVLRVLTTADPSDVRAAAGPFEDGLPSEADHAASYAQLQDWAVAGRDRLPPGRLRAATASRGRS